MWTAPGSHASPKSATTHDTGCDLGRYTAQNAPMHIWTDNPGEPFEEYIADKATKTLSKLQAVALASYEGSVGTACAELGFIPGKSEGMDGLGFEAMTVEREAGVDASNMGEVSLPLPPRIPGEPESDMLSEPAYVPLRSGDRFGTEHNDMLEGQGFVGEGSDIPDGMAYTYTAPDTDGRVLVITVDRDNLIQTMTVNGEPISLISLTPLPTISVPTATATARVRMDIGSPRG